MKKLIYCVLVPCVMFSCTNDIEESLLVGTDSVYEKKSMDGTVGNPNVIYTEDGELIYLTDTTTYHVCLGEEVGEESCNELGDGELVAPMSSTQNLTVYGYDWEERGEYKKTIFTNAAEYGLQPHVIYLACFTNINKNLPLGANQTILPRNYQNLVNVPMGWIPNSSPSTMGFSVSVNQTGGYATATTQMRYVNCDISGAKVDRHYPYIITSLIWYYTLVTIDEGWN